MQLDIISRNRKMKMKKKRQENKSKDLRVRLAKRETLERGRRRNDGPNKREQEEEMERKRVHWRRRKKGTTRLRPEFIDKKKKRRSLVWNFKTNAGRSRMSVRQIFIHLSILVNGTYQNFPPIVPKNGLFGLVSPFISNTVDCGE